MQPWTDLTASLLPPLLFGTSPMEIAVVLLVVLLLFGNKLPGMARNLGKSFIEFKKGVKGEDANKGERTLPHHKEPEQLTGEATRKES